MRVIVVSRLSYFIFTCWRVLQGIDPKMLINYVQGFTSLFIFQIPIFDRPVERSKVLKYDFMTRNGQDPSMDMPMFLW